MNKVKQNKPRSYCLSPYVFRLSVFGFFCMIFSSYSVVYFSIQPYKNISEEYIRDNYPLLVFCILLVVAYFATILLNSREYFGYVRITTWGITCYAPFRKPLVYLFADIKDIGVDYALLSGQKMFWIYIAKEKLPTKYCHKANQIPINQTYLRIQFSEKICMELQEMLPQNLTKLFNSRLSFYKK